VVITANGSVLLVLVFTVTATGPEVATGGTVATMDVGCHDTMGADTPLKVTCPTAADGPNPVPDSVTEAPAGPLGGDTFVSVGGGIVNVTALLAAPFTVTTTGPVMALTGAVAVIEVALQFETDADTPLNVTVLLPCVVPNLKPVMVTTVPTGPLNGANCVIAGGGGGTGASNCES
jgi:hypothetical protein